jgi:hypothetical protein
MIKYKNKEANGWDEPDCELAEGVTFRKGKLLLQQTVTPGGT